MPLSSNSIIHFTKTKDALKGILNGNFIPKYCKEMIYVGESAITIHVPMVSFCDIPLSQIKEHIGKYGEYGIGMTKKWATENYLNPVLYTQKNSLLSSSLNGLFRVTPADQAERNAHRVALINIIRYVKNYEGDLLRKMGMSLGTIDSLTNESGDMSQQNLKTSCHAYQMHLKI